jgi:hypothetical protein
METIVERPAGPDVHKASVMACVRVPGADGGRDEHVEQFPTTVQGLLTLADWLEAHGVTQVAMEATGVYWKPVACATRRYFGVGPPDVAASRGPLSAVPPPLYPAAGRRPAGVPASPCCGCGGFASASLAAPLSLRPGA